MAKRLWLFLDLLRLLFLTLVLATVTVPAAAQDVYVRGHFRRDGTYVQPHYRSNPDGNPYNNWSYPGNINPRTGQIATGNPETYLRNYYGLGGGRVAPAPSALAPRSDLSPMEAVQTGLSVLGFDPGALDGVPGPHTADAIRGFQTSRGLPVSGALDEKTLDELIGSLRSLDDAAISRLEIPQLTLPSNAEANAWSNGWSCKSGFYRAGSECVSVSIPSNATLDYSGHSWVCDRGFRRSGGSCIAVAVPQNGSLDYTGHDFDCNAGFRRSGGNCVAVAVPQNGALDYTGHDFDCNRGFRRSGGSCVAVAVPQNGALDYTGHDFDCNRGFRRSGSECRAVVVPLNGALDYTGHDFVCHTGFTRRGAECVASRRETCIASRAHATNRHTDRTARGCPSRSLGIEIPRPTWSSARAVADPSAVRPKAG